MNDTRTASILQRVPAILAVTANAYGLSFQAGGSRKPESAGARPRHARKPARNKPAEHR